MSVYRLKITCNDAQLEVVAKSGRLLAYEIDRYMEHFLRCKIHSDSYELKKDSYTPQFQQAQQDSLQFQQPRQYAQEQVRYQEQPHFYEQQPVFEQPAYTQYTQAPQPQVAVQPSQAMPPQQHYEIPQQHYEMPQQQNNVMSLSEFLAANNSNDVFSEFIVSAYYLKRVLNMPSFSIKLLNSKFYPATGTLVDLSIVDDARNRGFVDTIEEDGMLKYTLSSSGESYFTNQLRG